jgi:amino acid transporter
MTGIAVALHSVVGDPGGVSQVSVSAPARAGAAITGSGEAKASQRDIWIALIIMYIAWGSTYVGIRIMAGRFRR